jgi:hypothetical protein
MAVFRATDDCVLSTAVEEIYRTSGKDRPIIFVDYDNVHMQPPEGYFTVYVSAAVHLGDVRILMTGDEGADGLLTALVATFRPSTGGEIYLATSDKKFIKFAMGAMHNSRKELIVCFDRNQVPRIESEAVVNVVGMRISKNLFRGAQGNEIEFEHLQNCCSGYSRDLQVQASVIPGQAAVTVDNETVGMFMAITRRVVLFNIDVEHLVDEEEEEKEDLSPEEINPVRPHGDLHSLFSGNKTQMTAGFNESVSSSIKMCCADRVPGAQSFQGAAMVDGEYFLSAYDQTKKIASNEARSIAVHCLNNDIIGYTWNQIKDIIPFTVRVEHESYRKEHKNRIEAGEANLKEKIIKKIGVLKGQVKMPLIPGKELLPVSVPKARPNIEVMSNHSYGSSMPTSSPERASSGHQWLSTGDGTITVKMKKVGLAMVNDFSSRNIEPFPKKEEFPPLNIPERPRIPVTPPAAQPKRKTLFPSVKEAVALRAAAKEMQEAGIRAAEKAAAEANEEPECTPLELSFVSSVANEHAGPKNERDLLVMQGLQSAAKHRELTMNESGAIWNVCLQDIDELGAYLEKYSDEANREIEQHDGFPSSMYLTIENSDGTETERTVGIDELRVEYGELRSEPMKVKRMIEPNEFTGASVVRYMNSFAMDDKAHCGDTYAAVVCGHPLANETMARDLVVATPNTTVKVDYVSIRFEKDGEQMFKHSLSGFSAAEPNLFKGAMLFACRHFKTSVKVVDVFYSPNTPAIMITLKM